MTTLNLTLLLSEVYLWISVNKVKTKWIWRRVLVKNFLFTAEGQICPLRCSPAWVFASVLGCSPVSLGVLLSRGAAYRPSNIPIPDYTRRGAFTSAHSSLYHSVFMVDNFVVDVCLIQYDFRLGSRILCTLFTAYVSGLVVECWSSHQPVSADPSSLGRVVRCTPSPSPALTTPHLVIRLFYSLIHSL